MYCSDSDNQDLEMYELISNDVFLCVFIGCEDIFYAFESDS